MDTIVQVLTVFLSIQNILVLIIGMFVGTITGMIPGMTTVMGIALALPFTFGMDPIAGILLLVGVYKGGIYGGSITAITINTPGTPASACTVLDGLPLVKQGKTRKALEMALYSSVIADVISNLALIICAGWLAQFALSFGPPEYFTLIFFSLTIIAGVSGEQIVKGFSSACLGLLCATVGLDMFYGVARFTFGSINLINGMSFIPLLVGLFAIPEIISYFVNRKQVNEKVESVENSKEALTWAEFKPSIKTICRGSIIGVIMGAIPGLGAAPASFLSYSEAKRNSKTPEQFGNGALEGIAASESGNNGVAGSTMIPLLSLGVPGDVATAIMMGAFMVHGLKPGPLLFKENSIMVYAIFVGILLCSVFMYIIGKICIRSFSRISDIPKGLLFPMILAFCIYGSYAINSSTFDVFIMISMGIVGYFMLLAKVPTAPFIIAYVLGPLLEDSFRQALIGSSGNLTVFFQSFVCWFFWGLSGLSIIFIIKANKKDKAQRKLLA